MKRLTTDDEKSMFRSLNLFYGKDGEVWVRGGGPEPDYQDVTLVQWIKWAAEEHGLNIEAENAESLGDEMYDALQDGTETVEGIVGLLHAAAIQAAEMRERLKLIEDILGDDYDLDRLREMVEANREGRCRIHPKSENNTCGSCGHFQRISGRRCGTCDVYSKYRDRYGRVDDRRGTFTPSQSKKACKRYEPREE